MWAAWAVLIEDKQSNDYYLVSERRISALASHFFSWLSRILLLTQYFGSCKGIRDWDKKIYFF